LEEMGIRVLPQTLIEAIRALKQDPLFSDQLGRDFLMEYIRIKEMEWVECQRHVSDWEIKRYLEFY
ncbi:MAG: glutamine synthetase, partial [Acidobacteria bacterium]|nr:glutamine synthetase [Acidobacteriota bacterium]